MALFRTCFQNHITDLANAKSRDCLAHAVDMEPDRDGRGSGTLDALIRVLPSAELATLLGEARYPLRGLIDLFFTDTGISVLRSSPRRHREPVNTYLCRLMGLNPNQYNLPELFGSFLKGSGMYNMRERMIPIVLAND